MTFLQSLSSPEITMLLNIIQNASTIRTHKGLFDWLHDDIQQFIPHDILITAWGDFSLGLIHMDIVSYFPGVRTDAVDSQSMIVPLQELFERWIASERAPYPLSLTEPQPLSHFRELTGALGSAITLMRSGLVHGIKDERGRHDCLYVVLSANRVINEHAAGAISILLPHVDAALRQVVHLPTQYPDYPDAEPNPEPQNTAADSPASSEQIAWNLSQREAEILHWVCVGKTNSEIGQILDISFFTVKNHLQRIFRKMDVLNRAQAVAMSGRFGKPFAPKSAN